MLLKYNLESIKCIVTIVIITVTAVLPYNPTHIAGRPPVAFSYASSPRSRLSAAAMGAATVVTSLCYCYSSSSSSHSTKAALLISSRPPSRASPKIPPSSHLRRSIPALDLPRPPLWNGLKPLARPLSFGNFARKGNSLTCLRFWSS